jgi:hypothetical protein
MVSKSITACLGRTSSRLRTVIGVILLVAILTWLGVSSNPTKVRIQRLNTLISTGALGRVDPKLQHRLSSQFEWLAHHAGAKSAIVVDGPIRPHQLTLIVTTPRFEQLTNCGSGNAIFDPSLNTIFIDMSLVWPTEVNVIGTPSVNTMFSVDDLGYVASYTNFILAHELGHWQAHNKAAAFFYYGWNDGAANLAEEEAADQAAVRTLIAAGGAGDEPADLRSANALSAIGLGQASLSPDDRVVGDMLGGILLMTYDLLFASSPFSPYYSDPSHPNLLSRVEQAAREVESGRAKSSLVSETALVRSELERFSALGAWPHRELYLPGPLTTAVVRAGALWLGRTDIPDLTTQGLDEQIYRVPLESLSIRERNGAALSLPVPLKVGRSKVGEEFNYAEDFGMWTEAEFDKGDQSIQLPPAPVSPNPVQEKLGGRVRWVGGVAFEDMGWRWPARGGNPEGSVTERALLKALGLPLTDGVPALGQIQWQSNSIAVPVVVRDRAGAWTFRVFLISKLRPLQLVELKEYRWAPSAGTIVIGAARYWRGGWWVPLRADRGRPGDRVDLFVVRGGAARYFATTRFLIGQAGPGLRPKDLARMTPQNPRFIPISGDRAILGYDNDSLYLIDDRQSALPVLFHPAKVGLQILDLGAGKVLFWTLHARKAYLVDTEGLQ